MNLMYLPINEQSAAPRCNPSLASPPFASRQAQVPFRSYSSTMKTTQILALGLSTLSLTSAAPNSKRQFDLEPLPVSEATCCYVFGVS